MFEAILSKAGELIDTTAKAVVDTGKNITSATVNGALTIKDHISAAVLTSNMEKIAATTFPAEEEYVKWMSRSEAIKATHKLKPDRHHAWESEVKARTDIDSKDLDLANLIVTTFFGMPYETAKSQSEKGAEIIRRRIKLEQDQQDLLIAINDKSHQAKVDALKTRHQL
jgi:hypothetical protein